MPLFNGNLLQLQALLVAAYSGVSKGIANKGLKPDVTKSYPQQYSKWYSMHGDERSIEHTALYNIQRVETQGSAQNMSHTTQAYRLLHLHGTACEIMFQVTIVNQYNTNHMP